MTYKINITKAAENDINEAIDYVQYTLLNPKAASDLMDKAEEAINSLSFLPQKHPLVDDAILKAWGIRFILINNYIAFYTIDDTTSTIHIIRFLYNKRNWIHILRDESF